MRFSGPWEVRGSSIRRACLYGVEEPRALVARRCVGCSRHEYGKLFPVLSPSRIMVNSIGRRVGGPSEQSADHAKRSDAHSQA